MFSLLTLILEYYIYTKVLGLTHILKSENGVNAYLNGLKSQEKHFYVI